MTLMNVSGPEVQKMTTFNFIKCRTDGFKILDSARSIRISKPD